jgi:hypothetical protein
MGPRGLPGVWLKQKCNLLNEFKFILLEDGGSTFL